MPPPAHPLPLKRAAAAALTALTLAGCGGTSDALSHAVNGAAQASRAATRVSQQLMRSWCASARGRRPPPDRGTGTEMPAAGVGRVAARAATQRVRPEPSGALTHAESPLESVPSLGCLAWSRLQARAAYATHPQQRSWQTAGSRSAWPSRAGAAADRSGFCHPASSSLAARQHYS